MAKKFEFGEMPGRVEKRLFRDPLYFAYIEGQAAAEMKKPKRNHYPAGKRHDEFERGFAVADPLGDWHGRNE